VSRTNKGQKGPGYEYWASRLHRHGEVPGRITKRLTAKKERRADKELEREAMETPEEILEQTKKELFVERLDSHDGLRDRLVGIYGAENLANFMTPAMLDALTSAIGWVDEPEKGPRHVRHVIQYHHVPDREIRSVINCLIQATGEL
jgi:hypothetical protein